MEFAPKNSEVNARVIGNECASIVQDRVKWKSMTEMPDPRV